MSDAAVIGTDELSDVLYQLQASGCQVGVAGAVPPEAYRRLTRQVTTDDLPRHEIIGYVGDEPEAANWIDKPTNAVTNTRTSVARLDHDRRIAQVEGSWSGVPPRQDVYDETPRFLDGIVAKLSNRDGAGIESTTTLMSVYPVGYLADELDWDAVAEFIDDTGCHLRKMNGIGFYHLDRGVRNSGVEFIADFFDALVILRAERDTGDLQLKHKWHIKPYQLSTDDPLESEWLAFPNGSYIE
jgi:hypothetical protein